jgi:hypothetical protein
MGKNRLLNLQCQTAKVLTRTVEPLMLMMVVVVMVVMIVMMMSMNIVTKRYEELRPLNGDILLLKMVSNDSEERIVSVCILKVEALCSPETLVTTHKATWCYSQEKDHLQFHNREKVRPHLTCNFMKWLNIIRAETPYKMN